jgi:nucleoside 2-deoxyribosyltransferase
VVQPAIRGAGYNPIIVSGVEHINKIDDEIISQIRKSKFLVADFTGHRGGVYFEAGFAMGLGMPVFWSCRRDDLINLHFDVRQYNCIDWTDPADLAVRLKRRIEAVIGSGPIRTEVGGH